MKKIMFNDRYGLTEAVLSRRKTMTRRIIKGDIEDIKAYHANGGWVLISHTKEGDSVELKPAYELGEEVAIAQRFSDIPMEHFKAGLEEPFKRYLHEQMIKQSAGYKNKIFVVAKLMPHRIFITGIRVEPLQNISEKDCLREGVEKWMDCYIVPGIMENGGKNNKTFDTPRAAFAALIDRISRKGTWESNPWVFVYEFELIK